MLSFHFIKTIIKIILAFIAVTHNIRRIRIYKLCYQVQLIIKIRICCECLSFCFLILCFVWKINYIREKSCKEQFTENIVILLFYLFVLPRAYGGDSLLILLFCFVLKKKHIHGLKTTLKIVFLIFIQTNVSNFLLIAINSYV